MKPFGPPMLDIGRAGCGNRRQERGVEAGDEARQLRADPVGKTRRDALCIEISRTALRLRPPRRGGKDDVAVVGDDVAVAGHMDLLCTCFDP